MSTGNFDAGQAKPTRPVSNPFFDVARRIINTQFKTTDVGLEIKRNNNTGFERTTSVTPEQRIENDAQVTYAKVENTLTQDIDRDMSVDEMLASLITPESREYGTAARMGLMNDMEYLFGIV